MAFPLFRYNSQAENESSFQPPLRILVAHKDVGRAGSWRPEARIELNQTLRTSGFLMAIAPEDLKSLLVLLTFLSPNGHCTATLQQLAGAFHLSPPKARARLERLVSFRWQEQSIIVSHQTSSGLETYALAPGFLPLIEESVQPPTRPALQGAGRERVIEHSRRTYARPRAEVEAEIARLNGWDLPEEGDDPQPEAEPLDPHQAAVRQELVRVGLLSEQADDLLHRFDLVRIQRQLMWLPHRQVRNRAGFLLAAIKDDYAAPLGWKVAPQDAPDQPSEVTGDAG